MGSAFGIRSTPIAMPNRWDPNATYTARLSARLADSLETALHRPLGTHWGGHCWIVAEKPGERRFPAIEGLPALG